MKQIYIVLSYTCTFKLPSPVPDSYVRSLMISISCSSIWCWNSWMVNRKISSQACTICMGWANVHSFNYSLYSISSLTKSIHKRYEYATMYTRCLLCKRRHGYEERVREIERGTLIPLLFTASGGMAPTATITFKSIANKRKYPYHLTINIIRCQIYFALIRSAMHGRAFLGIVISPD